MILGFAIATVPLIVAMWRDEQERRSGANSLHDDVLRDLSVLDQRDFVDVSRPADRSRSAAN
ncbi:MAG: hypothetical protein KGQ66_01730 [Acidobacteriota bacterium]|nr:hypothetical protein [Acidobacteriota bacterium]